MLRAIVSPSIVYDRKELIAYHEAGHAIVGAFFPKYDRLMQVSLNPSPSMKMFREDAEKDSDYMFNSVKMTLGGFVAEELAYGGVVSTDCVEDLEMAYTLCENLGNPTEIIGSCYEETMEILKAHRNELDLLKTKLVNEEIVDGQWVYRILFTLT